MFPRTHYFSGLSALVFALLTSPTIQAQENVPSPLAIQGFGTVGAVRSTNGNADFVRDLSQPNGSAGRWTLAPDTLLGLQANIRGNDQMEVVAQMVAHHRYDNTFRPELTSGFLKYDPNTDLSFRLGRFGTEFFMLADSRMVGYSYLTVRPPGDYFGALPLNYVDGVFGRWTTKLGSTLVRTEIYSGLARERLPSAMGNVLDLGDSRLNGISLDIQYGPWLIRTSHARLRFHKGITLTPITDLLIANGASAAASALDMSGSVTTYRSAGVIYDDGTWQALLDYNATTYTQVNFENPVSGYVLLGRRIGHFTPFAGYSWTRSSPKQLETGAPALNALVANRLLALSHKDQRTTLLGVRWDFRRNMDLKFQLDIQRGNADSVALVQNSSPAWDGSTKVLSLTYDFVF